MDNQTFQLLYKLEATQRYVTRDLELWPIKNSFCAFLVWVKTYTYTKN